MRRHAPLLLAIAMGCSTLAPKPPEVECTTNEDCVRREGSGWVCEADVCRDGSGNPPLTYIGLDLREVAGGQPQFRAEFAGCDREVADLDGTSIKVLSLPRREVARRLRLAVYESGPGIQDPIPLPSTFTINQGSRFAREDLRRQVAFDLPEESDDEDVVEVGWPRYHIDNDLPSYLGEGGFLVWQTQPLAAEDAPAQALRYQMLSPPITLGADDTCLSDLDCCPQGETCTEDDVRNACVLSSQECRIPFDEPVTYNYVYAEDCDRTIRGRVISVDRDLNEIGPVPGASITVRHADPNGIQPLGLPRLDATPVEDRDAECDVTADCADGLRCNTATAQCELPLAGLTAWTGTLPADEGQVDARVFTYCEGLPSTEPLARSFDVSVTPPEELGSASVTLQASVEFDPIQAGQTGNASFGGDLCVPALGQLEDFTLALSGEPRTLLEDYTCCDIDCLPRTAEDAESGPPEPRTQCAGATSGSTASFRVETPLVFDDDQLDAWNATDSPCVPIQAEPDGTVGVFRRSGACGSIDMAGTALPQCDVRLAGGDDGGPREYALRIETPTGSVSGSLDVPLTVETGAGTTIVDVELPDRILVRGRVLVSACDREDEADGDCGSPGAQVLAERLRVGDETVDNTPGPYAHQVSTFHDPTELDGNRDGAYILPLDAGVWVVTALPDSGTDGGPARLSILDLREAGAEVDLDFALEAGILVTVDVSSFDRRSQIIPLDTGSWLLETDRQLFHPDAPDTLLDLGAPGECLSTDGDTGCRIRRLIGGSSLPPTQIGQVRFTTRDTGLNSVDCR